MFLSLALVCVVFVSEFEGTSGASVLFAEPNNDNMIDTPIVGVLSQEISPYLDKKCPGVYKSYIAASYVKFIESAGGRVVPLWVLWPGGAAKLDQPDGYADAGRYIYDIAMEMNDRGQYMPIFGTCLGFELFAVVSSDKGYPLTDCQSNKRALSLIFQNDFRDSFMFGSAPDDVIDILAYMNRSPQISIIIALQCKISQHLDWMKNGRYPFFSVIFHPEKPIFEWVRDNNIPHTSYAIRMGQYFADFFVGTTRRNMNFFPGGVEEENRVLIYNYPTNFTALVKSTYTQCYLFDENVSYKAVNS